ncbi:MAG: hypothetical protein RL556_389 [Actinomycetota bacterium]|jgi:leader peptidase (prepilin peptidase)/N-methyltransferase
MEQDIWFAMALAVFAVASVVLSVIDFRTKLLPNKILLPAAGASALLLLAHSISNNSMDAFGRAVLVSLANFGIYFLLKMISPISIGMGDVKLAAYVGLMVGYANWQLLINSLMYAFFTASIVAVVMLLLKKTTLKGFLAFGPFMLLGAWMALLS